MQILIIPLGFLMWLWAYKAKPRNANGEAYIWEEENYIKRAKLQNILEEGFWQIDAIYNQYISDQYLLLDLRFVINYLYECQFKNSFSLSNSSLPIFCKW